MEPFEGRIEACQSTLSATGLELAVLSPGRNLQYLTGIDKAPSERPFTLLVPATGEPAFVVPALEATQLTSDCWVDRVFTYNDTTDPFEVIDEALSDLGVSLTDGTIVAEDTMWHAHLRRWRVAYPSVSIELASSIFDPLRRQKDAAEIEALRTVAHATDSVVDEIRSLGTDVIGWSEAELAGAIENRLADVGGSGVSFETIVGAGPNGAKPHHTHGDREIAPGEPVVLDFGTRMEGYPSDQTRTVVFDGEPPSEVRNIHEIVLNAQQAAIAAIEPGVCAATIDQAAREVITAAGYGDAFIHRTGHGVGLAVHEPPYITADNDHELQVGEVFSVEPGIYLPDQFGVRIEDLVVVTEDGYERLNRSNRALQ
ncbi:M24 family metallopeptidase [Halocatena halophila]|uniref:M24 family metallopeptidase n=1 Tax=Halocatena halophila TaxID=2814576 RepID=UPI002ED64453